MTEDQAYEQGVFEGKKATYGYFSWVEQGVGDLDPAQLQLTYDQLLDDLNPGEGSPADFTDELREEYEAGVEEGATLAFHEVLCKFPELDLSGITEPAARYCGEVVVYVWDEGGDYEFRARVEVNSTLVAEVNLTLSSVIVAEEADEDSFTVVARGVVERLLAGLDDEHDQPDPERYPLIVKNADFNGESAWVSTDWASRWEDEGGEAEGEENEEMNQATARHDIPTKRETSVGSWPVKAPPKRWLS